MRHEGDGVLTAERGELDSCLNTLKLQGVPAVYRHGGQSQDYLKVHQQRNASVVLAFHHTRKNSYQTGSKVSDSIPEYILNNPKLYPFFEDALGASDGSHFNTFAASD